MTCIRPTRSRCARAGALRGVVAAVVLAGASGCASMAVGMATPMMQDMMKTVNDQRDPQLVEDALPSNLLLLDGLAHLAPDDEGMATLAAQAFCSYAMVFVQDEDRARANTLFWQGTEHGLRALRGLDDDVAAALDQSDPDVLAKALAGLDEDDLPVLFWAGNCWAGAINSSGGSPRALLGLPKVEQIMLKALDLDPTYYHGGPHLFMALYYAGRPKIAGGDPEKAREHFEKVFEITEGKFLLAKVFYAQYYARAVQDRDLYVETLEEVLDAPDDILPGERLATEVAKKKAEALLDDVDLYF